MYADVAHWVQEESLQMALVTLPAGGKEGPGSAPCGVASGVHSTAVLPRHTPVEGCCRALTNEVQLRSL